MLIFHVIAFSKYLLINASYHRLALLCYHTFAVIVTLMSSWMLSCGNDITLTRKEEKANRDQMINVVCLVRVSATSAHGDGTGRRARRTERRQLNKHSRFAACSRVQAINNVHARTHACTHACTHAHTHARMHAPTTRVEFRSRVSAAHKTERRAKDLRIASTFRSVSPLNT